VISVYNGNMTHFILTQLIKENALRFGEFELSSGAQSSYFLDMSKITNLAEGLDVITLEIARSLPHSVDTIGGPALGAASLVSGVILNHRRLHYGMTKSLRGFLVRKEPKNGEFIEGFLQPRDNVVIVEDVVTTGKQTLRAIEKAEEKGAKVVGVYAVVDRLAGAADLLERYNFKSLLTIEDLGIENGKRGDGFDQ
jgi:orotate phosphoribosyltransferase